MSMWPDSASGGGDLFGLAGMFPQPGWVVLDAARAHRYTGELVFLSSPPTRLYFDAGRLYLAERITDPSIGARLIDAGVVTATQLERGMVRAAGADHLGRLFERVPQVDRDAMLVTLERLTEECVGWLAAQLVPGVEWAPYRHHPSGVHAWSAAATAPMVPPSFQVHQSRQNWDRATFSTPPAPSASPAPLPPPVVPAPAPVTETPVTETPVNETPEPIAVRPSERPSATDAPADDLVEWEEPSWLGSIDRTEPELEPWPEPADEQSVDLDWVDQLESSATPPELTESAPDLDLLDGFEIRWPSGEIDDQFGSVDSVDDELPDFGAVPDTAHVVASPPPAVSIVEAPVTTPPVDAPATHLSDEAPAVSPSSDSSDDVVLAVRRAVASIDVGSLAGRQRIAETTDSVTRSGDAADAVPLATPPSVGSHGADVVASSTQPEVTECDEDELRSGALRKLISSLRR